MKVTALVLTMLLAVSLGEITEWNKDGDKIPDDLITEVAAGEEPIMVLFFKDATHRGRLVDKINDSGDLSDSDFTLATVDMNTDKYFTYISYKDLII